MIGIHANGLCSTFQMSGTKPVAELPERSFCKMRCRRRQPLCLALIMVVVCTTHTGQKKNHLAKFNVHNLEAAKLFIDKP